MVKRRVWLPVLACLAAIVARPAWSAEPWATETKSQLGGVWQSDADTACDKGFVALLGNALYIKLVASEEPKKPFKLDDEMRFTTGDGKLTTAEFHGGKNYTLAYSLEDGGKTLVLRPGTPQQSKVHRCSMPDLDPRLFGGWPDPPRRPTCDKGFIALLENGLALDVEASAAGSRFPFEVSRIFKFGTSGNNRLSAGEFSDPTPKVADYHFDGPDTLVVKSGEQDKEQRIERCF